MSEETDSLLAALSQAAESNEEGEGALTMLQVMAHLRVGREEADRRMDALRAQGRAELVFVKRRNRVGRWQTVPAYRIVE